MYHAVSKRLNGANFGRSNIPYICGRIFAAIVFTEAYPHGRHQAPPPCLRQAQVRDIQAHKGSMYLLSVKVCDHADFVKAVLRRGSGERRILVSGVFDRLARAFFAQ